MLKEIVIACQIILRWNLPCHAFTSSTVTQTSLQFPAPYLWAFTPSRKKFFENPTDALDEPEIVLLNNAVDCSLTDSCPIEEAQSYLSKIEHVQEVCLIDTNPIEGDDFCKNQDVVAQVVSKLNEKIYGGGISNQIKPFLNEEVPFNGSMIAYFVLAIILLVPMTYRGTEFASFHAEEWWWALRDNYFPMMVIQFIKDGGLISS